MLIAIINDQHFGVRNDSIAFLKYFDKFYSNVFFPTLEERKIEVVLDLGDTFDRRKYVNFNTLKTTKEIYFNKLKERNIKLHSIVGNHSTYYKDTNNINSLDLLLKEYDNISVYNNEPVELVFDDTKIMLSPWLCSENYQLSLDAFNKTDAHYLMGHFEFQGFEVMKGIIAEHGLDREKFGKFDMILSGHFHHPSKYANIHYLGAPYEMTWSDYNGKRGFHIFDTTTKELTFIENPYKMFNRIEYDDSDLEISEIDDLDVSKIEGSYMKIIIHKKTNPYIFDLFIDKIQSGSPSDIKIIEQDMISIDLNEEISFDETQNALDVLNSYITLNSNSSNNDNTNTVKIQSYVKNLYREATNL